jgi:hypothetical protein
MLVGVKLQPKISKDLWLFRYDAMMVRSIQIPIMKKNPSYKHSGLYLSEGQNKAIT